MGLVGFGYPYLSWRRGMRDKKDFAKRRKLCMCLKGTRRLLPALSSKVAQTLLSWDLGRETRGKRPCTCRSRLCLCCCFGETSVPGNYQETGWMPDAVWKKKEKDRTFEDVPHPTSDSSSVKKKSTKALQSLCKVCKVCKGPFVIARSNPRLACCTGGDSCVPPPRVQGQPASPPG